MPYRHVAGAIVCSRQRCRHPECDRAATQAGWGCRQHHFKLPPDLRDRLYRAATAELGADRRLGPGWQCVADEADRWAAERAAAGSRRNYRQPELPL